MRPHLTNVHENGGEPVGSGFQPAAGLLAGAYDIPKSDFKERGAARRLTTN